MCNSLHKSQNLDGLLPAGILGSMSAADIEKLVSIEERIRQVKEDLEYERNLRDAVSFLKLKGFSRLSIYFLDPRCTCKDTPTFDIA
uniref:Uncharacterized protein n=1 Tax=Panagrolaimus sp. ES5 TaxID=591445 RepID=A0AC34FFW9_9BILA